MTHLSRIILIIFTFSTANVSAWTDWVDFEIHSGSIYIPVEVYGKPTLALLDSGSNVNAINLSYLDLGDEHALAGRTRMRGVTTTQRRDIYRDIPIKLFGTNVNLGQMVGLDLPEEVGMLLGGGFFEAFTIQIDYPNSRIRFIDRANVNMADFANVETKKDNDTGLVFVRTNFDEENRWLLFDTGAETGLLVSQTLAQKNNWAERFESVNSVILGINGNEGAIRYVLPQITFGPYTIEQVPTLILDESNFSVQSSTKTGTRIQEARAVGILGSDILKHFVVTLDFKNADIHIIPGEVIS